MEVWEGDDSVWTLDASHTPRPLDVRLSPDGQAVLMLRDEHLVLHDLITGEEHVVGAAEDPSTGEMALSADGKLVAYCDEPVRELKVAEVANGKSIANPPTWPAVDKKGALVVHVAGDVARLFRF